MSPGYVLTAAHCFDKLTESVLKDPLKVRVRIGATDLQTNFTREERQTYAKIEKVLRHPGYKRRPGNLIHPTNDIALVLLGAEKGEKQVVRLLEFQLVITLLSSCVCPP